jgi:hypothetical protein
MMHCGRAVARAPLVFNMAKARMSRVTTIGLDSRAQWSNVNDKGVLIDAGDTAIRTEEPSTMEVKVCEVLSLDAVSKFLSILWQRPPPATIAHDDTCLNGFSCVLCTTYVYSPMHICR